MKPSDGFKKIASGLREFGYPDATPEMVAECHAAWTTQKNMPHGVIGAMLKSIWDKQIEGTAYEGIRKTK